MTICTNHYSSLYSTRVGYHKQDNSEGARSNAVSGLTQSHLGNLVAKQHPTKLAVMAISVANLTTRKKHYESQQQVER